MLTTIIGTAIGFIIASLVVSVIALYLCMSKTFMGWYMRKVTVATKEVMEELVEEYDEL